MSDIKIVIGSEVSGAVTGLRAVQGELGKTATISKTATTAFTSIGSSISSLGSSLISGGVITGIALLSAGVIKLVSSFFEASEKAKQLEAANIAIGKSFQKAAEQAGEEIGKVTILKAVLESENATRLQKLTALEQLKKINPDYFGQLDLEKGKVEGLSTAYEGYLQRLYRSINAKANVDLLTEALKNQSQALANINKNISAGEQKFNAATLTRFQINDAIRRFGLTFGGKPGEARIIDFKEKQLIADLLNAEDQVTEISKRVRETITDAFTPKPEKIKKELKEVVKAYDEASRVAAIGNIQQVKPKERDIRTVFEQDVVIKPKVKFLPQDLDAFFAGLNALFDQARLEKFQEEVTKRIQDTFTNIIADSIGTIADAVGEAIAGGGNFLPNLFEGLIKGIGSQLKELGKYLVQVGVEMIVAKKAIEALKLTPQTAIIAGFALQLLGSTLTAAATKKFNSAKFATGVRNFEGGIATVGERGPETIFLPRGSSVQPNNEVNAFGGGSQVFIPAIRLSGSDLVIAFNRASAQMGRNN